MKIIITIPAWSDKTIRIKRKIRLIRRIGKCWIILFLGSRENSQKNICIPNSSLFIIFSLPT